MRRDRESPRPSERGGIHARLHLTYQFTLIGSGCLECHAELDSVAGGGAGRWFLKEQLLREGGQ